MTMDTVIRQSGVVTVVDIRGNIVQGKEIDRLRDVLKAVLNEATNKSCLTSAM